MEKQLEAMRKLGFTDEEIQDILKSDKAIDKGEKLFNLPKELEAGAKKARQAERKKPTEPVKRERKTDNAKIDLIKILYNALVNNDDERFTEVPKIEILNPEREIYFEFDNRKFKINLIAPRK